MSDLSILAKFENSKVLAFRKSITFPNHIFSIKSESSPMPLEIITGNPLAKYSPVLIGEQNCLDVDSFTGQIP